MVKRLFTLSLLAGCVLLAPPADVQAQTRSATGVHRLFPSTDIPKAIPDNDATGVTSTVFVDYIGEITDLNIYLDAVTHPRVGDLMMEITSPMGTTVRFMDRPGHPLSSNGCSGDNIFGVIVDDPRALGGTADAATQSLEDDCQFAVTDNAYPSTYYFPGPRDLNANTETLMNNFDGEVPYGTWTLRVMDVNAVSASDVGSLDLWQLEVQTPCTDIDPLPPECQVLPVELADVQGVTDGNQVTLTWSTLSETNNAGFAVEHRGPGVRDLGAFERLGFVEGVGTTTEAQRYRFTTSVLETGTHTFRLQQLDHDGTFVYSPHIEVTVELPGTHELSAPYPNPFNPQTQFRLTVDQTQEVRVEVVNLLGRRVALLHDGALASGTAHTFTFEATDLPSGTYLVRAVGERFSQTRPVVLLK